MTPPAHKKPTQPAKDSVHALLQDLMNANLSSGVVASYFIAKSAAKFPAHLTHDEAVEYADRLRQLALCEKETDLLCSQLKDIQAGFPLRSAVSLSRHALDQGLRDAFEQGIGIKIGLYEIGSVAKGTRQNLALARKNLDPQKINQALATTQKAVCAPPTCDRTLAAKLNL